MNPLDRFLSVAARQMRAMPAAKRDDELRELRGHLEQRVEDYLGAGMSAHEAQVRALKGLGSPRALGAQLCDAWEGVPFSWWRLAAAIVGVTAFLLFGIMTLIFAMSVVPLNSEAALLPEIVPVLCGIYIALPWFCGLIFSRWLGRRGRLVATLYFLALAWGDFTVHFPKPSMALEAPPESFVGIANAAWFPYFWAALAFIGAWVEQVWRAQTRYILATGGAHVIAPERTFWVRLNLKLWRNALLFIVLVSALYPLRVWLQFHPRTPQSTLYNYLILNRQMNRGDFEPPKILALRELPPQSAAEIAGTQQRIWFKVEARMTPQYAARRVAWIKRVLAAPSERKAYGAESLRHSLARMQRNRQVIQGMAILVKTSGGWKLDEKSFDSSRLSGWAYDLYYQS